MKFFVSLTIKKFIDMHGFAEVLLNFYFMRSEQN